MVDWPAQCAVVIPCLNEARRVGSVIAGVRRQLPNVIVVDDGSTDDTAAVAARSGASVIREEHNQGKGTALSSGLRRALELGFDWVLVMDGDGQHSPEDIPVFLRATGADETVLVIGNRMTNPRAMPWLRRCVNRWMSRRLTRLAGQPLPDSQCGFRLVRLDAWAALRLETPRFEVESETALAFAAAGHSIRFVPIQVIYRTEKSKINPITDTVRWLLWWRRARRQFSRAGSAASKSAAFP